LVLGSIPLLFGLAVVMPVLGHATWHLYRKAVEPNLGAPPELRPEPTRRRYAAEFPASLFARSRDDVQLVGDAARANYRGTCAPLLRFLPWSWAGRAALLRAGMTQTGFRSLFTIRVAEICNCMNKNWDLICLRGSHAARLFLGSMSMFYLRGAVLSWLHAFAAGIILLAPFPAWAEELDLVTKGKAAETVFSDGLPNETGHWRTKVQLVFDSKTQRIERRVYEYFDPAPTRDLDIVWYPRDVGADRPGRITGIGRLVWRQRGRPAWDPAGVVSVFTGEMRNGRPHGTGELVTNDGLIYKGAWQNGRPSGSGHLKLPSGAEYSGSFRNGMADGKGREFDITGEVFEGTFRAGLRDGKGKTKLPSGWVYESNWTKGVESPRSRRTRLAQLGGPSGVGGGEDLRMGIAVLQRPRLPEGVELDQVIPYSSSNDGRTITVQPADDKLIAAWKGNGSIETSPSDSPIREGIFNVDGRYIDAVPPTFLIEFQNHSRQPAQISSLRLDVVQSDTDNQPAMQLVNLADPICGSSYATRFNLENLGWSAAKAARLRISFAQPGAPMDRAVAKALGDVAGRQNINLEPELEGFRVNIARLRQVSQKGFPCPSGSMDACLENLRSNPLFGMLGSKLALNNSQIIVPVSGFLDYQWTDNRGGDHSRSSPFAAFVGLGKIVQMAECGEGGAPEPTRTTALQLRLDAANYTLPVAFQRAIAPGEMARFSLPVGAAKSSSHTFRIVAALADGRQIASLPIRLLYFRPRALPPRSQR
jgi:hypothetical protein